MKPMRQKLHSKRGASMVMALLLLFFCLTVGAIVLTAASSNAGRVLRNRTNRQNELTVQSASQLLQRSLTALSFTGQYRHTRVTVEKITFTDAGDGTPPKQNPPEITTSESYQTLPITLTGTDLADFPGWQDDFAALFYSQEPRLGIDAPAAMAYQMELTAPPLPPVAAVMKVQTARAGQYTLTAELSLADGAHKMALYFDTHSEGLKSATTTNVVSESLGEGDYGGSKTTTTVVTTYTQHIGWKTPEITKGASPWVT